MSEVTDKSEAMRWYVVHTHSGYENKAKKSLEDIIRKEDAKREKEGRPLLSPLFGEVLIPMENVVEMVKGEKRTSKRKFFPGYILIQLVLTDDTKHIIKNTPKITGFVGDAINPQPVPDREIERITSQVQEGTAAPKPKVQFVEGDTIRVIDGPFANFNGTVEEVLADKGKVRVQISIFGRATPVTLDFMQVEKAS